MLFAANHIRRRRPIQDIYPVPYSSAFRRKPNTTRLRPNIASMYTALRR
jgi:hypothetical protein